MKVKDDYNDEDYKIVKCPHCGWEGKDTELDVSFYDLCNMYNPVGTCCPICALEIE